MLLQFSKLLFIVFCVSKSAALDFKYHKYEELQSTLKNFTASYTKLSLRLDSIGKSVQGRELWVVEITSKNDAPAVGVPNVKLIGNIHGNEAVGREVLLHFIKYLGDNYGVDAEITWLLNNTNIYILPSMNPDGFEKSQEGLCSGDDGRCNAKKFDLNRNFPIIFYTNIEPKQPEAQAVEDWMKKIPFILSASLHGGALVANYPFESVKEATSLKQNPPSLSPDDDVFIHLAHTFANKHPTMHQGLPCSRNENSFVGGITNGAAWYPIHGGMQDFNYVMHGCMELTLEISCCKYPNASKLQHYWEENKDALVEYIKQAHQGVSGKIVDTTTGHPINGADLKIIGRDMNFTTSLTGVFWRLLLPGNYTLQINAQGYHQQTVQFSVSDYGKKQSKLTKLEIQLINDTYPIEILTTIPSTSTVQQENLTEHGETLQVINVEENLTLQNTNYSKLIREQVQNSGLIREEIPPEKLQSSCGSQICIAKIVHIVMFWFIFIAIYIVR